VVTDPGRVFVRNELALPNTLLNDVVLDAAEDGSIEGSMGRRRHAAPATAEARDRDGHVVHVHGGLGAVPEIQQEILTRAAGLVGVLGSLGGRGDSIEAVFVVAIIIVKEGNELLQYDRVVFLKANVG